MPHPLLTITLAILWLLLVNQLSAGQVVLGALLGWLIPFATSGFWPEQIRIRHPLALLRYFAVFIYDIVRGSFQVAFLILRGPYTCVQRLSRFLWNSKAISPSACWPTPFR